MRSILGNLIAAAIGGFTIWAILTAPGAPDRCRIEVSTYSGDLYVVGVGDDLASAWQGVGDFPADWREIAFPGCYGHE